MTEYITKAQAIDYIKSMEVLIGCTGVGVLTKGIEGLEGCEAVATDTRPDGVKVIVLEKSPFFMKPEIKIGLNESVCKPFHGVWYRTPSPKEG